MNINCFWRNNMYIKKELQHIIKTSLLELNISTDESDIILTKKDNYYTTNIASRGNIKEFSNTSVNR